ncbi:hypothetical protein M6B38_349380 [Iris pallida]|uniref:Uncharacterized protein n=1 Tax=Iris pallida TaxID=29817 RepID=A0AAX6GRB5_IRIPA|nr:hypothetical protein M6B38_349380 [Iris pallida]
MGKTHSRRDGDVDPRRRELWWRLTSPVGNEVVVVDPQRDSWLRRGASGSGGGAVSRLQFQRWLEVEIRRLMESRQDSREVGGAVALSERSGRRVEAQIRRSVLELWR